MWKNLPQNLYIKKESKQTDNMDNKNTYTIKFGKDNAITLKHKGTLNGEEVYSSKFFDFDFDNKEKSTMIITVNVAKTKESDKRYMKIFEIFSQAKRDADDKIENTEGNE